MSKSCFVIMPIKTSGSPEHLTYRALYETVIKSALVGQGFDTVRADEVTKAGLINKDVIRRLAEADLVVADLTDLNPNVFYELGIRHALRSRGTILFADLTNTEVPFDLRAYRVIDYTPDLLGYEKLRQSLATFAGALTDDNDTVALDSPVHDVLPSLPTDLLGLVAGSTEGRLQERIADLQSRVRRYEEKYGQETAMDGTVSEVLSRTLSQARRGELPTDLFRKAHEAARSEDAVTFLTLLNQLADARSGGVIKVEQWLQLSFDAAGLNLDEVASAISLRAIEQRPGDPTLKSFYYGRLAHSEDPRQREQARTELRAVLGITFDGDEVVIAPGRRDRLEVVGLMLDAYHRDSLHDEALKITERLVELQPDTTLSLRNHARALNETGRRSEAMQYYVRAMAASDVDDTTATWFGNDLSLSGRLEASCIQYCRACELDADDAGTFLRLAGEIADVIKKRRVAGTLTPDDDQVFRREAIHALMNCAFSCSQLSPENVDKLDQIVMNSELDESVVEELMALRQGQPYAGGMSRLLTRAERAETARMIRIELETNPLIADQLATAVQGSQE